MVLENIEWVESKPSSISFNNLKSEHWTITGKSRKFSCLLSYREASSWDGVGRMASLTLQKLQICVRTKAIFKLEIKGKELDSW